MASSATEADTTTAEDSQQSDRRPSGFVADIILNAVEPGVNYSVILFLNIVFVVLFSTLVLFTIITDFNIHLIFLSILTLGLMIGINIFISQLQLGEGEKPNCTNSDRSAQEDRTANKERTKQD